MKVRDVLNVVDPATTVWLQKRNGTYCEANEKRFLSNEYADFQVVSMCAERYPAIGTFGITLTIE